MPGPLFIASTAEADAAGVYAVEISPPRVIEGVSNGFVGLVAQFAWGPANQIYTPEGSADFLNKFEPAGSPRSSTGYRAVTKRRKLPLKVVRPLGAGHAQATNTAAGTLGDMVSTAKYSGTLGNSITRQIAAAASGDATKRDLTYVLTDSVTGTTTEIYRDVPLPAGAIAVSVDVTNSKLLASIVLAGTMTAFPANGTAALAAGSNGAALGTADYVGTAGLADKGVSLFETDGDVRVISHDDCGNTNRAAINSGFAQHALDMGDRIAVLDGDPDAADWTTVKGYVTGGLVGDRVIFNGAWNQVYDDAGVLRTSPWSTFIASAIVNLDPQKSHAWWDDEATDYYVGVQAIVANFSVIGKTIRKEAFERGICLPIKLGSGRFALQHDRNTNTLPSKRYSTRRRVTDYLALSLVRAFPTYVNGPNLIEDLIEMKMQVDNFLGREESKRRIASPTVGGLGFQTSINMNTPTTMGLGECSIGITAITPAPREKIFFLMNVGPTVTITEP